MDTKERILLEAKQLFMHYGLRNVSMDDMARHLAMSKKTLYQYFTDKDDLVQQTLQQDLNEHSANMENCGKLQGHALQNMLIMAEFMKKAFGMMNPLIIYELRKYYPKAWEYFLKFRDNVLSSQLRQIILKGIQEGFFRDTINVEVVVKMRIEQVQAGFDPTIFPPDKFNFYDTQLQMLEHFLFGLVTPKGYDILVEYKKSNNVMAEWIKNIETTATS